MKISSLLFDFLIQSKISNIRSHVAMEAVYNKTLTKLFNGAKNVRNNNLQLSENTFVINQKAKDVLNDSRYEYMMTVISITLTNN